MNGIQDCQRSGFAQNVNQPIGIDLKKCKYCDKAFPIGYYHRNKHSKDGHVSMCKSCEKKKQREYYLLNKDKIIMRTKQWKIDNNDKYKELLSNWYQNNKERHASNGKKWREKNKDHLKKYFIEYNKKNSEKNVLRAKKWKENNPEKTKLFARKYNSKKRSNQRNYMNEKIGALIRNSLKGRKGGNHWENIVGFTFTEFVKKFESMFQEGMTWDNHGKWHIDHIVPVSAHNFSSYDDIDFKKCWSLDNLRPMWAADNLKKHNKLTKPFQPSLTL